jgi:hypothetical protein
MTGLAEAGLISSNLSKTGVEDNGIHTGVLFEPDRCPSFCQRVTEMSMSKIHQYYALEKWGYIVHSPQLLYHGYPARMYMYTKQVDSFSNLRMTYSLVSFTMLAAAPFQDKTL